MVIIALQRGKIHKKSGKQAGRREERPQGRKGRREEGREEEKTSLTQKLKSFLFPACCSKRNILLSLMS